jgi:hypothetical protein
MATASMLVLATDGFQASPSRHQVVDGAPVPRDIIAISSLGREMRSFGVGIRNGGPTSMPRWE